MLLRIAMIMTMLLGLGGFGTVAVLLFRPAPAPVAPPPPLPPPPQHWSVLAAAGALRAGTLLRPEDLTVADVTALPPGAMEGAAASRTGLAGAMLRRSLSIGEVLQSGDVMRPGDHGFLAAVLQPGHRAASVAVDSVSGSAGLIWPGDHVDVILTLALEDQSLPASRKVAAETVLADVRVIAVDQLLVHGVAPSEGSVASHTVTLDVTPPEAERVAVAARLGRLSLSVRSAEAGPPEPAAPTTIWGGDVSAALGRPAPSTGNGFVLKMYLGEADGKEFRF
jgi:pilus assembly protein CpaB